MAEDQEGWVFDSLGSIPGAAKSDGQQVYEVLLKMVDRWNAHDVDGHLEAYWKSPQSLVVVASAQYNGWPQLHGS